MSLAHGKETLSRLEGPKRSGKPMDVMLLKEIMGVAHIAPHMKMWISSPAKSCLCCRASGIFSSSQRLFSGLFMTCASGAMFHYDALFL